MPRHFVIVILILAAGLTFAETALAQGQNQSAPAVVSVKNDYGNQDLWLCRPGRQDACAVDLTTTIVTANGKLKRETWAADPKAAIDCFYVYPTVSTDQTPNSDMIAGAEEK